MNWFDPGLKSGTGAIWAAQFMFDRRLLCQRQSTVKVALILDVFLDDPRHRPREMPGKTAFFGVRCQRSGFGHASADNGCRVQVSRRVGQMTGPGFLWWRRFVVRWENQRMFVQFGASLQPGLSHSCTGVTQQFVHHRA